MAKRSEPLVPPTPKVSVVAASFKLTRWSGGDGEDVDNVRKARGLGPSTLDINALRYCTVWPLTRSIQPKLDATRRKSSVKSVAKQDSSKCCDKTLADAEDAGGHNAFRQPCALPGERTVAQSHDWRRGITKGGLRQQ